ncbi:nuclear transport factor 2 family protein [Nocardia puris]|uniref:Ketosteroid isomerase-like protein n=1 Tax=Nocardia puris TaxID=208602 RepID=A0A366DKU8_9NOCA|nr:nuclear transport factor 2 family protein [Nocardia puris]MBF6212883.1 nuclear transport factor 2 family protein [Nocardia puris]MBF6367874.1 nuclear transport factor 2 family protein [Nocardia puris]MBF6463223.1 nuclear transport factor 2 family protein [Nocardia puris]RBO90129.1 ketosteroid isomerase-like protein [Nocardia puris]
MYHYIVKQRLRDTFEQVNRGNYPAVVAQFAPTAEHWFSGDHALGGGRRGTADITRWYDRLATLLPDLAFTITDLAVAGGPWKTFATVRWTDSLTDREGTRYTNEGVHIIELRWGKVHGLWIYCDTVKLSAILETLAKQGVEDATAPPITT